MKNVHLLSTDKSSRFFIDNKDKFHFREFFVPDTIQICKNYNIYITSNEEIKEECWCEDNGNIYKIKDKKHLLTVLNFGNPKKIILTTDQDLIKDGVQAIDDEFLEWFVKNPSCENRDISNNCFAFIFFRFRICSSKNDKIK